MKTSETISIACVSQKGGTGKSTYARALADAAYKDGMKVKIADLDIQQGTIIEWHRKRLSKGLEPVASVELFKTVDEAFKAIGQDTDLLLIDGPARASKQTAKIAHMSDLVIQPTGPSLDDLKPAVFLFHELHTKKNVPKDRLLFIVSRVGTEAEFFDAHTYLTEAGYKVLDDFFFEKPAYRQAQNHGRSVLDTRYPSLNEQSQNVINKIIEGLLKKYE